MYHSEKPLAYTYFNTANTLVACPCHCDNALLLSNRDLWIHGLVDHDKLSNNAHVVLEHWGLTKVQCHWHLNQIEV